MVDDFRAGWQPCWPAGQRPPARQLVGCLRQGAFFLALARGPRQLAGESSGGLTRAKIRAGSELDRACELFWPPSVLANGWVNLSSPRASSR